MTLQLVKPISMKNIEAEFEAPAGTPLSAFVRGGAFVPDTGPNAGVPLAKPIAMTDLLGAENVSPNVMNVGIGGGFMDPFSGFIIADFGTMTPFDALGVEINGVYYDDDLDRFNIIFNVGGLPDNFFSTCTVTGTNWAETFTTGVGDLNPVFDGGTFSQWQRVSFTHAVLNTAEDYDVLFTA